MTHPHDGYYVFGEKNSMTQVDKGLAKICFSQNITESFFENIKKNFQKDIWARRIEYIKYSIKQYFE